MKLGESKTDPVKVEQGAWVGEKYGTPIPEMGDLCLKTRGLNNKDYRKLQSQLYDAVPRKLRMGNRLPPEHQDRITAVCLRDTCLLDWENVEGDGKIGEPDKPVAYDKKVADRLLTDPEYRRFQDAAVWAATVVGEIGQAELEEDAKN